MKKLILFSVVAMTLASCDKNNNNITPMADQTTLLTSLADDVITTTYIDLNDKVAELVIACQTLEATPTAMNLEAARQAWRNARIPWEQAEGFLFGPVDAQGIDPSIDSWPVNFVDLNNVLSGSATLDKTYIDGLEGTLKGFHTIEYLLFGTDANKQVSDFTPRQFEYLAGCSASLEGSTTQLENSWLPTGLNYANKLKTAGSGNSVYPSQKAALQEIVTGIVTIADEVANGKIQDPYAQSDSTLEESRYSANSKADFANNIRSIQNVYLGTYAGYDGEGLSDLVLTKNEALDAQIRQAIIDAILGIENIPGTFTDAIVNNRQAIGDAQQKVRNLQDLLQNQLATMITNL